MAQYGYNPFTKKLDLVDDVLISGVAGKDADLSIIVLKSSADFGKNDNEKYLCDLENKDIIEISVDIFEMFNGADLSFTVGVDGYENKYLSNTDVNLKDVGTYIIDDRHVVNSVETIKLYLNGTGMTAGSGTVTLKYLY